MAQPQEAPAGKPHIVVHAPSKELLERTQERWLQFEGTVEHPLKGAKVSFDVRAPRGNERALAWLHYVPYAGSPDAYIDTSVALIEDPDDNAFNQTLLHETIHLSLGLGVHNERWKNRFWGAKQIKIPKDAKTAPEINFYNSRKHVALTFGNHPDEVFAELVSSRDFPDYSALRVAQLVGMAALDNHELPAGPLHGFWLSCRLIRRDLVAQLASGDIKARADALVAETEQAAKAALSAEAWAELEAVRAFLRSMTPNTAPEDVDAAFAPYVTRMLSTPFPGIK